MNILYCSKKKVYLDSGLDERQFSKMVNGLNFNETGIYARTFLDDKVEFKSWNFDGTNVNELSGNVVFEGNAFNGQTVLDILKSEDSAKIARVTSSLINLYINALQNKIKLPSTGAGGIFYNEKLSDKDKDRFQNEFLFLPESLFDTFALNQGKDVYAWLNGFWQNKNLTENNSIIFTASVICYYALSKKIPFASTDTQIRQEDILDSNFIQIENKVNGLNAELAADINMGLNVDNTYQREELLIPLRLLKKELGLREDGSYTEPERTKIFSDEQFDALFKKTEKNKKREVKQKRIFKRHSISILVCLALFALFTNYVYRCWQDHLEKPTAKGLTCFEAIETFYSGFHQQNTILMRTVAKGQSVYRIIDMIGNVYVTSTTRTAYEAKNSSLSPELFLTRPELMDYWLFGITGFSIDDRVAYNRFQPPKIKDVRKIKNDSSIPEGKTEEHVVKYNLVYSSGADTPISVDRCTAKVKCVYKKGQWYLNSIQVENITEDFSQEKFKEDYTDAYKESQSPKGAVELMRKKYDWLPDDRAMDDGKKLEEFQKNYFK